MPTPLSILRESVKAVPAVKYALGLAGVVSVIAIIRSFDLDFRVAILGTVVMFLLMTLLVVFARLSSLATSDFRLPALVFTWFSLLLVIAIALSMFLSVFIRWPVDLQDTFFTNRDRPIEKQLPPPEVEKKKIEDIARRPVAKAVSPAPQAMKGADTDGITSPALNTDCPEIVIYDSSKYPPESRKERRCVP